MSSIPPHTHPLPRLITYYQTHHTSSGKHISILPLLNQPSISLTHVILAAIHINEDPDALTLNDHSPDDTRFKPVWDELGILQKAGIKVLGMLGGAAKGSYERLDGSDEQFEKYYAPLKQLMVSKKLDGLDLDVEEEMSLAGIIKLIDRLRKDFGKDFIITLAPVAMAMLDPKKNLSGFDYEALEVMRAKDIAWYNTQFYCGWGDLTNTFMYDRMLQKGWSPEKLVIGVTTSPDNANGFVPWEMLSVVLDILRKRHQSFGGVMGWEYCNSLPGGAERPWDWASNMSSLLRAHSLEPKPTSIDEGKMPKPSDKVDPDPANDHPQEDSS